MACCMKVIGIAKHEQVTKALINGGGGLRTRNVLQQRGWVVLDLVKMDELGRYVIIEWPLL